MTYNATRIPSSSSPSSSSSSASSNLMTMNRHVFQTRVSLALAAVTMVGLILLSIVFAGTESTQRLPQPQERLLLQQQLLQQQQQQQQSQQRWLEEEMDDDDAANDNNDNDDKYSYQTDYSKYSCNNLYTVTPHRGDQQCQFARTCNLGEGVWLPVVFCSHAHDWLPSMNVVVGILSPFILLWMVLLFRLLGSTAEDYFSPALEMFSLKLGLPPRFAGVSLLALGNGAADVSATVSAITNDPEHGYLLSLGALTGAAMVISTVVSALVVLVAGGVPCRGALVRDVAALGIAVIVVWYELGGTLWSLGDTSSSGGVVGPETVTLFLSSYAFFVLLVLCADVYHRAVVIPRQRRRTLEMERQRQLRDQRLYYEQQQQGMADSDGGNATTIPVVPAEGSPIIIPSDGIQNNTIQMRTSSDEGARVRFSAVLTAFSNYDADNNQEGWGGAGVESQELTLDRPILLHGAHGLLSHHHAHHHPARAHDADHQHHSQQQHQHPQSPEAPYTMLNDAGVALDHSCDVSSPNNHMHCANGHDVATAAEGTLMVGGGDSGMGDGAPVVMAPYLTWRESFEMALIDLKHHADEVWEDIAYNGDLDVITKYLLIIEIPFLVLRKMTVPIPCEGFYVRGLIALSLALSPLWMGWYMGYNQEVMVWNSWIFWTYWALTLGAALAVMRYAPSGQPDEPDMNLWFSTPIALYGFAIAATWIDTIANSLVSLLDFIGIVLRIPGPIVGLTILAWGNSMSDLSANMTMARKGLANMAMTACFAGPFFNFLVGLGLGFSRLAAQTGVAERKVTLEPSISVGFLFLALNSVVILVTGFCMRNVPTRGSGSIVNLTSSPATTTSTTTTASPAAVGGARIPKKYGYIALTLYTIYVVSSIVLQYAKVPDDEDA